MLPSGDVVRAASASSAAWDAAINDDHGVSAQDDVLRAGFDSRALARQL
jgi:hypothetical protein